MKSILAITLFLNLSYMLGCGQELDTSITNNYIAGEKIKTKQGAVEWPPYPWQTFETGESVEHSGNIFMGLRVGLFTTYASLSVRTSFDYRVSFKAMVVKYKETPGTKIFSGSGIFNFEGEEPIIGRCSYSTSASAKRGMDSYLNMMGSGGGYKYNKNRYLQVSTNSDLFVINESFNLNAVQAYCRETFEKELKDSVLSDLKSAIRGNLMIKDHPSGQVRAIVAAIHGPKKEVLVGGYRWVIHPALILEGGGQIWVKGKVTRKIRGWWDKEYSYLSYSELPDPETENNDIVPQQNKRLPPDIVAQKLMKILKQNINLHLKEGKGEMILDKSLYDPFLFGEDNHLTPFEDEMSSHVEG